MYATIGNTFHPVESFAQVSAAYRRTIDELGLGASETPRCLIVDRLGRPLARVSYNGRIWAHDPGETDAPPLYDPR